jgi:hypothetical protein
VKGGFFDDMCQNKLLYPSESESIEGLTNVADRANLWYKVLESRSAENIQKWIELLKKYSQHEPLAAELQKFYEVSVKLYYKE